MKRIKDARKICKISQIDMANLVNMEQSNYSHVENGEMIKRLPEVKKKAASILAPILEDIIRGKKYELQKMIELLNELQIMQKL